jgi:hypothetical protein
MLLVASFELLLVRKRRDYAVRARSKPRSKKKSCWLADDRKGICVCVCFVTAAEQGRRMLVGGCWPVSSHQADCAAVFDDCLLCLCLAMEGAGRVCRGSIGRRRRSPVVKKGGNYILLRMHLFAYCTYVCRAVVYGVPCTECIRGKKVELCPATEPKT